MLTVVLMLNLLIAGLCWYGVWRIWRLRQALIRLKAALTLAEQDAQTVLPSITNAMRQGQTGTAQLRQHYQQIVLQFQQIQQLIALLGVGQLVWRQYERRLARYPLAQDLPGEPASKRVSKRQSARKAN